MNILQPNLSRLRILTEAPPLKLRKGPVSNSVSAPDDRKENLFACKPVDSLNSIQDCNYSDFILCYQIEGELKILGG